jgi:hypothetical protein
MYFRACALIDLIDLLWRYCISGHHTSRVIHSGSDLPLFPGETAVVSAIVL